MKIILLFIMAFSACVRAADVDLKESVATFTNLQGRVYENVILRRAIRDGVIYSTDNGSGMVCYTNLSILQLAAWGLSTNLPQEYRDRKEGERQAKIQAALDRQHEAEQIRQERERKRKAAAEWLRTNPPPEIRYAPPSVTPRNSIGLGA